jgi:hypothetical protein
LRMFISILIKSKGRFYSNQMAARTQALLRGVKQA